MTTQIGSPQQWPRLRVEDWTETRNTLHMWAQVVGKIRLSQAPYSQDRPGQSRRGRRA